MVYTLPELPYSYEALDPHIDSRTMQIHHTKHHQTYIDKLNAALEKHPEWQGRPIEEVLRMIDDLPDDIQTAVVQNGGGHANHSLFWQIMTPNGGGEPVAALKKAIEDQWGDFETFKEEFNDAAKTRFGSGWAWLVVGDDNQLEVYSTPNQDSPYMDGKIPILGLDVWEHAYYLKYQNRRVEYIDAWWNVVNWEKVSELYGGAISG